MKKILNNISNILNRPMFLSYTFMDFIKSTIIFFILVVVLVTIIIHIHLKIDSVQSSGEYRCKFCKSEYTKYGDDSTHTDNLVNLPINLKIENTLNFPTKHGEIKGYIVVDQDTKVKYILAKLGGKDCGYVMARYWEK